MNIGIISHKKGFFKIFLKKQPNALKKTIKRFLVRFGAFNFRFMAFKFLIDNFA